MRRAGRAGHVDIRESPTENLRPHRRGARPQVGDLTVVILDRPRHEELIDEIRATGARIKLISDGDLSAAISCAVMGTGVHAVMGIGGAPEGVLTAAALRCLGGEIQARFRWRSDEERARARADGHRPSEERVYTTDDLAPGETSSSPPPASPTATCSRACASSAAAHALTRW